MKDDVIHLATRAKTSPISEFEVDKLLNRAKERASDPSIFDEVDPFFWRAQLSNSNLDSYYTRMTEKTLRNFAKDAEAGISYQNSHKWGELGFGQSLNGVFTKAADEDVDDEEHPLHRMYADFFTLPDLNLNGVNTTDFIKGIRSGVTKDVSVGFHASDFQCGICGEQMYDGWFGYMGECDHIPGFKYAHEDDAKKKRTAFVYIDDGHLSEGSSVYDGATPDAGVLKATLMARANKLTDLDRMRFRSMYGVRLPDGDLARSLHPVAGTLIDAQGRKGTTMTLKKKREPVAELEVDAVAVLLDDEETTIVLEIEDDDEETTIAELTPDDDDENPNDNENDNENPNAELDELRARFLAQGIKIGTNPVKAIRALADKVVELTPLAKDGATYREDLVADAITQGVRAKGDKFKSDYFTEMFKRLTIEDIKVMRDDWQADGDLRLTGGTGKGGRRTILDGEEEGEIKSDPSIRQFPASAFKVGS